MISPLLMPIARHTKANTGTGILKPKLVRWYHVIFMMIPMQCAEHSMGNGINVSELDAANYLMALLVMIILNVPLV
jgi:hypothetical protein